MATNLKIKKLDESSLDDLLSLNHITGTDGGLFLNDNYEDTAYNAVLDIVDSNSLTKVARNVNNFKQYTRMNRKYLMNDVFDRHDKNITTVIDDILKNETNRLKKQTISEWNALIINSESKPTRSHLLIDEILKKMNKNSKKTSIFSEEKVLTNHHSDDKLNALLYSVFLPRADYDTSYNSKMPISSVSETIIASEDNFRHFIKVIMVNNIVKKTVNKLNSLIETDVFGKFFKGTWFTINYSDTRNISTYILNTVNKYGRNLNDEEIFAHSIPNDMLNELNILIDNFYFPAKETENAFLRLLHDAKYVQNPIDAYGTYEYLLHHPFLFALDLGEKIQMYKFFVTNISLDKIEYELYQIDSNDSNVNDSNNISNAVHKKIITRDLTNKFEMNKFNVYSFGDKFIWDRQQTFPTFASLIDETAIDYIKISKYWTSVMCFILTDATKCIKAFIDNPSKTKFNLDSNLVSIKLCESILNEFQFREIKEFDLNLLLLGYESRYSSSELYKYHPFYLLKKLNTNKLYDGRLPLFTKNKIKNKVTCTNMKYHKHKKVTYLTDMFFVEDIDGVYNYTSSVKTDFHGDILTDLLIKSNFTIKIYFKIADNCLLVTEGKSIHIPATYTRLMNACFIKVECKETELDNTRPYVLITCNVVEVKDSEQRQRQTGFMMECTNENQNTTTLLYFDERIDSKRIVYMSLIDDSNIKDVEKLIS